MARRLPVMILAGVAAAGLVVSAYFAARDRSDSPSPTPPQPVQPKLAPAPQLPAIPPALGDQSMVGRVEDGVREPLAGVTVTAAPEGADAEIGQPGLDLTPHVSTVTNERGEFTIAGLAEGHYRVRLEGEAVLAQTVRFVSVPASDLRIVALRAVALRGQVFRDGVPAAGATVVAVSEDTSERFEATARDDGTFVFSGLREGRYRTVAYQEGRAAKTVVVDRGGPGPFAPVRLELEEASMIKGRVIDGAGRGVAAVVELTSTGEEVGHRALSDEEGEFVVEAVRNGRWRARAVATGYLAEEAIEFEVGGGYQPVLRVSRGAQVIGRVVDERGAAVTSARITVRPVDGDESAAKMRTALPARPGFVPVGELGVLNGPIPLPPPPGASSVLIAAVDGSSSEAQVDAQWPQVDSQGHFSVSGLRAGRYRVDVMAPGFTKAHSVPFALGIRGRREVVVELSRGATIRGRVRGPRGRIPAGALAVARLVDGELIDSALADGRGRFQLGPVSLPIVIAASAPGYAEADVRIDGPARDGEVSDVELVLEAADRQLRGRLLDPVGMVVASAEVQLEGGRRAFTSAGGRFTVEGVRAGAHRAVVIAAGYPRLEVTLDTAEDNVLTLERGGGIELLVLDAHTRGAVVGARVELEGPTKPEPSTTDDRGRARMEAIRAGSYRIRVSKRGYAAAAIEVEVPIASRGQSVSLADLRVELLRGSVVAGTIRDENGERVAGARVSIGDAVARSDRLGKFRIEDAPPGEVEVSAAAGPRSGALPLSLQPGDTLVTVEVTIR